MTLKFALVICVQVCVVKLATSQCITAINDLPTQYVSYPNTCYGLDLLPPASTLASDFVYNVPYTGSDVIYANLDTVSGSQIAPGYISVTADNLVIDGFVSVSGSMPLYGAVVIDGNVPTSGQASLVYNAGNGVSLSGSGAGVGIGSQVVTGSGPVVASSQVVTSPLPVFGNQVLGSPFRSQIVTSSGPVLSSSAPVFGSSFQLGVNPGVVTNVGCGCY